MAAREIVRRRPPEFQNLLLPLMTAAPASVRRVVSRSIGQAGFDQFWERFDRLNKPTRQRAGGAMLKLLPDAAQRLRRRLASGPVEQRLKAMQMSHELGLGEQVRDEVLRLCADPDPRLRSKAVTVAGNVASLGPELQVTRLLTDADARVRANTIEVLESRRDPRFIPVFARQARAGANRERANAIKALHRLRRHDRRPTARHAPRRAARTPNLRASGPSARPTAGSTSPRSAGWRRRTRASRSGGTRSASCARSPNTHDRKSRGRSNSERWGEL